MVSAELEDELDQIIKSSLESPWRLNLIVQFMVFLLIEVITVAVIRTLPLSDGAQFTYFVISLAFFYPLIIKTPGRIFKSLAFGFFGAALLVLAYNLAVRYGLNPAHLADIALFLLVLEIISIFLLRHTAMEFRITRTMAIYIFDAIASLIFFGLMMTFLYGLGVDIITNLLISITMTVIYGYSILPEHIV